MATKFLFLISILAITPATWAAGYGGGGGADGAYAFSIMGGTINSTQDAMNTLIQRANQRVGGISTSPLDSAYEAALGLTYRFSGTIYALQLRPSYFYEMQTGKGSGNSYNYGLRGFTVFPIFRLYPLENDFMKFYMQVGLGYGQINGEIDENDAIANFKAGGFGTLVGLGAEFCFTPSSCLDLEGNYRYLSFDRSLVTSTSGSFASDSLSQYSKGSELELDQNDVATNMSGLQFMAAYTYWF